MANHTVECEHCGEDLRSSDHAPDCITKSKPVFKPAIFEDEPSGVLLGASGPGKTILDMADDIYWTGGGTTATRLKRTVDAVWDQAVAACASAIKEVEKELAAEGEVYILLKTVEALRSLKRTDKTESDNGGCQAKSTAVGDTVSAPMEPLHSDIIAEAVRNVSWKPDKFYGYRDETGRIFVSADGQPIMDFPSHVALELGKALVTLAENPQTQADAEVSIAPTRFGNHYRLPMPADCDVVILCGWNQQIQPRKLLLPHQVYTETVNDVLKYFDTSEAWVIPARSKDYIKLPILEGEIKEENGDD